MGMLADLAIRIDPALIFERVGKVADPWQAEVVRKRAQQQILNWSRQSGKTLTVAAMATDEALHQESSLTLILSPTERQSKEMLAVCRRFLGSIVQTEEFESESVLSVRLRNSSRIVALPAKDANVRGFSAVSLAIIDEASRVPDELYNSVRPMLAVSGGRIVLLSTPFGKRGFFHKEWTEGDGWDRAQITADRCPRITAEFLKKERLHLPESWFRQEYFCEFLETDDAVFRYDDIQAAMSGDVLPMFDVPTSTGLSNVEPMFQ